MRVVVGDDAVERAAQEIEPSPERDPSWEPVHSARRTLSILIQGLTEVRDSLDEEFATAVEMILGCEGRTVLTGMGKSGLICQKIAATFSSTGTPAHFLHPADALHGDLGIVTSRDLVVAASYSGETDEILRLLPTLQRFEVPIIAITGNPNSTLARASHAHLGVHISREACPLGLAPTTSTAATLAIGDALAIALIEARGFTAEDFAAFHPGGSLGRRLLLRVEDVMHTAEHVPLVESTVTVLDALFEITSKRFGVTGVTDGDGRLLGVFTDGDLRRLMTSTDGAMSIPIGEVVSRPGQRIDVRELASEALRRMEERKITSLFVVDGDCERPIGIVHLHDLVKLGVA